MKIQPNTQAMVHAMELKRLQQQEFQKQQDLKRINQRKEELERSKIRITDLDKGLNVDTQA